MSTPIEAPLTLLQVPVKTIWFDPVETPQMALSLTPKILDSVDVISFF
jgi:hypothetical protein